VKFDDEVARQLKAVVGESYDPPRRWGATFAKWAIAAILAIGAAVTVVGGLEHYIVKAHQAPPPPPPPSGPVPVQIIPAK
jgi:hypothetical protein